MKLFKYFIIVVVFSTLSSMMLDAAKRKQDQEHSPEQSKKARTKKVDIDTALIKQEQKKQEQSNSVFLHTILKCFLDQYGLHNDMYIIIFDYLNPDNEKEFHQLLKDLTHADGKADSEQMGQMQKIITNGFYLSPSSSIENITLTAALKNNAPSASIRLLLGHCNNYEPQKRGEIYALAAEHKNLDLKIVDELKNKFLDTLKDEKSDYKNDSVNMALVSTAKIGQLAVVQELIQNPLTNALLSVDYIKAVLETTALNGHPLVIRQLIKYLSTKASLLAYHVGMALMAAARKSHISVVQELIQNHLTKDLLSAEYVGPALEAAANNGRLAVVRELIALINASATNSLLSKEALHNAIKKAIEVAKTQEIKDAIQAALDQREAE